MFYSEDVKDESTASDKQKFNSTEITSSEYGHMILYQPLIGEHPDLNGPDQPNLITTQKLCRVSL